MIMNKGEGFVKDTISTQSRKLQLSLIYSGDKKEGEQEIVSTEHSSRKSRRVLVLLGTPLRQDRRASEGNMIRRGRL